MGISHKKYRSVHGRNEQGFTLVEMLIALTAFCMLMSFLPIGIRTVLSHEVIDQGIQRMEWEVFYSQMKKEIRLATEITVLEDKLLLKRNNDTILYEKYGSNLRRRVNYTGHEILLQNVVSVQFERLRAGFTISVTDLNGVDYEGYLRSIISVDIK
ncbi:competence type IV pilus minor pilin ComGF [Mesobacillus persicus]|nr:competence type IV pilus minor pilin ComGF [Mesobacillus persicus]